MRIGLLTDIYKPSTNGVVHHIALLKQCLEKWHEDVWLFLPGDPEYEDDEPHVIRTPGIPLADTGYHISLMLNQRSRKLLSQMDVLHVHHPFVSGSYGLYFATRYNIPLIFTNHTRYDLYVKQYLKILPSSVSETALQTFFHSFSQRCSALVAPSESVAEIMGAWGVEGKIVIIPNGVDIDRFAHPQETIVKADLGLPENAVVATYVGRMSGEKSIDRLLQLFAYVAAEYEPVYLVLVGDGPELDTLRGLAGELGLDKRVRFTGGVGYEKIPAYMTMADFFVSASVSEVHPLTFIEAGAAGLPALGIRSPGVTDIIADGRTGFIAENNDLSFGLRFLRLAQDAPLRQALSRQAVEHSRGLSVENNARRLLELYTELRQR